MILLHGLEEHLLGHGVLELVFEVAGTGDATDSGGIRKRSVGENGKGVRHYILVACCRE